MKEYKIYQILRNDEMLQFLSFKMDNLTFIKVFLNDKVRFKCDQHILREILLEQKYSDIPYYYLKFLQKNAINFDNYRIYVYIKSDILSDICDTLSVSSKPSNSLTYCWSSEFGKIHCKKN